MSNSNYVPNAGLFAKLLSDEDISVTIDPGAKTASFSPQSRNLRLPNWLGFESDSWYLFIAHEVGHALFTPADAMTRPAIRTLCAKHKITEGQLHTVLNVLEDIRIERLIREKYRGLPSFFAKGYAALLERNFFGFGTTENLLKTKWATYKTMDRLNLYAKIGNLVGLKLTKPNDIKWFNAALKAETFEDILTLADDVLSGLKLKANEPKPQPPAPKAPSQPQPNPSKGEKSEDKDEQGESGGGDPEEGEDDEESDDTPESQSAGSSDDEESDEESEDSDSGAGEDPEEGEDDEDDQSKAGNTSESDDEGEEEESKDSAEGDSKGESEDEEETLPESKPHGAQGEDPEADEESNEDEESDSDQTTGGDASGDSTSNTPEPMDPEELESETRDTAEESLDKAVKADRDWSAPQVHTLPVSFGYLNGPDRDLNTTLDSFFKNPYCY